MLNLEGRARKLPWPILMHCGGVLLMEWRKPRNACHDSRSTTDNRTRDLPNVKRFLSSHQSPLSSSSPASYSWGPGIESRPGDRLSWKVFVVFLSFSRYMQLMKRRLIRGYSATGIHTIVSKPLVWSKQIAYSDVICDWNPRWRSGCWRMDK